MEGENLPVNEPANSLPNGGCRLPNDNFYCEADAPINQASDLGWLHISLSRFTLLAIPSDSGPTSRFNKSEFFVWWCRLCVGGAPVRRSHDAIHTTGQDQGAQGVTNSFAISASATLIPPIYRAIGI